MNEVLFILDNQKSLSLTKEYIFYYSSYSLTFLESFNIVKNSDHLTKLLSSILIKRLIII